MATSKEFRDYLLTKLCDCDEIFCRSMMGEYLLYSKGVLFGGIYNERLLFKIAPTNEKYNMNKVIPYQGAKPMYICEDVNNTELLKQIVDDTCLFFGNKK